MMTYTVEWVENKKDDWKIATLKEIVENGQSFDDVSINKTDKKNVVFPNFDQIAPGVQVSGNIWKNPASGKYTLFAPDPKPAPTTRPASPAGAGGGARGVAAAQGRKEAGIEKAQDRKETGIMVASAMRDSTLIATSLMGSQKQEPWSLEEFTDMFERIKKWYLAKWRDTDKSLDVPF